MPLIVLLPMLGITAVAVGGLVFRDAADQVQETAPDLIALASIGLVAFVLWKTYSK